MFLVTIYVLLVVFYLPLFNFAAQSYK